MGTSTADLVASALACLRVAIYGHKGRLASPELKALVAKLVTAFLETRWVWPRQFEQMTPYAFILSDPRAKAMDRAALQLLARELQVKLFGMDGGGEVVLLLFEGPEMERH